MTHHQNLVNPQLGNQTITKYMQDVKHNIDSLSLMNVAVDFDELSIRVLNYLGSAYSNISHTLQARATSITFEELFEQLLSYEAQMKILVHSAPPASTSFIALVTLPGPSSHRRQNNRSGRHHGQSQQSWPLPNHPPPPPPPPPLTPAIPNSSSSIVSATSSSTDPARA